MKVNLPLAAGTFLTMAFAQFWGMEALFALRGVDLALLVFAITFDTFAIVIGVSLVVGAAEAFGGRRLALTVWSLALMGTFLLWGDSFGYRWLALHLRDSVPMLIGSFQAHGYGIRAKLTAFIVATFGSGVISLLATVAAMKWASMRPRLNRVVTPGTMAVCLVLAGVVIVAEEYSSRYTMSTEGYAARQEAFWISDLLRLNPPPAPTGSWVLKRPAFKGLPDEGRIHSVLSNVTPGNVTRECQIYVFIVDSLRHDAVTPEVAPNLHRFARTALNPANSIANANCTHPSWVSILHGVNPLYWSVLLHQHASAGSVPLRILRKAGYRVHVISTPKLEYFGFGSATFGSGREAVDEVLDQTGLARDQEGLNNGDLDRLVTDHVIAGVRESTSTSRDAWFCFLHSPHHHYEWPDSYTPAFTPFHESSSLSPDAITRENVELLRNRYKNAVHHADSVIGSFLKAIEERGLMDSSIIVVTGDHGEEFLEEGHLVHASALNQYQLRVPILIHVPPRILSEPGFRQDARLASHMDIFPSLFHVLGLEDTSRQLLAGKSLFGSDPPRYAIAAQCGSLTPHRLLIQTESESLILNLEAPGKVGTTLYARRLSTGAILDGGFNPLSRAAPAAGADGRIADRFRAAIESFVVLPR